MIQPVQPEDEQQWKTEQEEKRSKRFARMNCSFLFFLGLGFMAICGYAQCWHKAAVASLWALAALATGAFAGLLFGVQRVRQPKSDKSGSENPSTEINNNLAEVSDWLTKIIVGVGLIELSSLPGKLHKVSQPLANCLGGDCGLAAAIGIIIFFSVTGFLIGFVDYRTFLALLIRETDDQVSGDDQTAKIVKVVVESQKEIAQQQTQKQEELMKATFQEISFQQIAENALGLIRSGKSASPEAAASIQEALQKLKNALANFPTNRVLAILIGRLHHSLQQAEDALSTLKETLAKRRKANIAPDKDDAALLFNIACYENLEAQKLASIDAENVDAENKRETAWESLQQSCKLDPNNKYEATYDDDLRTLFKAGKREAASL